MMASQDIEEPLLDLGMLEESPAWKLSSRFLVRSKLGGRPSWLQPTDLPNEVDLLCDNCKSSMLFLCQLYAPIEEKDSTFHRTIFVFMCKKPACHQGLLSPFLVFRNQLPRKNSFYPYEAPPEVATWRTEMVPGNFSSLCRVCGCSGNKKCAGCKKVTYCSRDHQTADWKARHKIECSDESFKRNVEEEDTETNALCFPLWEIVMHGDDEDSSESSGSDDEDDQSREQSELQKYNEMVKQGKTGTLSAAEVEKYSADDEENPESKDKGFLKFMRLVKRAPKQVVRYSRGGKPLWVSDHGVPRPEDIPNCEACNEPRIFEFQIMPQLLASLKLDSLDDVSVDWGTLAVFACQESCHSQIPVYKKEFLWKQNMPQ